MKEIIFVAATLLAIFLLSNASLAEPQINFTKIIKYKIPDQLGKLIGDARVNIYDYDYNELGSLVILNGTINQTGENLLGNATHKIFVKDADTLQKIFNADSFVKEFNRQRSLHNIDLQAVDFLDQIKLTIGTWIVAIISLFISPE